MSSKLLIDGEVAHTAPEIMLFDKDGTIIDIHHYWSSMIRIRSTMIIDHWFSVHVDREVIKSELINEMGVNLQSGRIKAEGPVGIEPRPFIVNVAANVVRNHGTNVENEEMENIFSMVDQITAEDIQPLLKLLPGARSLLQRLSEQGIVSMIVSTDITQRARKAMEVLQLDHYFADIIGADQVLHTKPSADLALLALERSGYTAQGAVVVGDHPVDIKMGSAAEVSLKVGVLTGLSDAAMFNGLDCRVVADLTAIEIEKEFNG